LATQGMTLETKLVSWLGNPPTTQSQSSHGFFPSNPSLVTMSVAMLRMTNF
jgi:hypothetical protein